MYTSPKLQSDASSRPPFQVNRKTISAFLQIGRGLSAIEQFSMVMGLPGMSSSTYSAHIKCLSLENVKIKAEILRLSHTAIRQAHIELNPHLAGEEILNIAVSYDGTWHKRGHTSHYGMGIAIDVLTGLVIDFHILSRYCSACDQNKKILGDKTKEYEEWQQSHNVGGECEKNFTGSSNSMEVAAAEVLWKRSINVHKFRYVSVLSDGDCKTYSHLQKLAVYGPDISIAKEECLNHIAKRLKNIVTEWRVKGVTLGGRKPGNLKEETIVKLANYYRSAITKKHS